MANSFVQYTGDGATVIYTVTFPFLSRSHVTVRLDGTATTAFTWLSDTQIQFSVAPADDAIIDIRRSSSPTSALVNFSDGARIKESDLDTAFLQTFYLAQEANEGAGGSITLASDGVWDAGARRIKNINVPVNGSDAATKSYVDTALTNLPINLDESGNIDGEARRLTNLANGIIASDAVTKEQLDAAVVAVGSVPAPANPSDNGKALMAASGSYSWQTIGSFLPLTGGTLTGALGITNGTVGSILLGPGANRLVMTAAADYGSIYTDGSQSLFLGANEGSALEIRPDLSVRYLGPAPSAANDLVPKSYVDAADAVLTAADAVLTAGVSSNSGAISSLSTTIAGKANLNAAFDWLSVWTGSSASSIDLVATWGPGVFRVVTGAGQYAVISNGAGTLVQLDLSANPLIPAAADIVSDATNTITTIYKLRKV